MVPVKLEQYYVPEHPPAMSANAWAFLNHLRFVAMSCRVLPQTQLFKACAMLHAIKTRAAEAHSKALMRCLEEALGKKAKLHAPGVVETSFDERWLVQLGQAAAQEDMLSLGFLLQSRVSHEHQRLVTYLVRQVSEYFELN